MAVGHREQLESLRDELASVLASGADQRTAQAELAAKAEAAVAQIIALRNERRAASRSARTAGTRFGGDSGPAGDGTDCLSSTADRSPVAVR